MKVINNYKLGIRNFWRLWVVAGVFVLVFRVGFGQIEDLPPLVETDVEALIADTDSLRFSLYPEVYQSQYMLLDSNFNNGWPPIPFMPDVFDQLVLYPDSGTLDLTYGKFQVHSMAFYDYGGVHFNQINLAPLLTVERGADTAVTFSEDNMVTVTLATSLGRAWIRFDEEAESDEWLESFVEKRMVAFGPEVSGIRVKSSGAAWLSMFTELLNGISKK